MRKSALLFLAFIGSFSFAQVTTISQPVVGAYWYSGVDDWGGQSFTISQSGQLEEIRFYTYTAEGPTTFEVREGQGGALLYTANLNITTNGWISVPLPNIQVCEGLYCFMLSGFQWGAQDVSNPYPGGCALYSGSWSGMIDMTFEVDQYINLSPGISSALPNISVCSGSMISPINFTITDENVGAVTVTGSSSNTAVIPNAFLSFGGSGASRTLSFSSAPTTPGTTTITITVSDGLCSKNFTFNITVNPLPTVNAGPDLSGCAGQSITLTGSGANTYLWDNGATNGVPFVPGIGTVVYTVTGADMNGCQDIDNVSVTINPLPAVNAGADIAVCAGGSVTLNGSGAISYIWDNGASDGVAFVPAASATYTVIGTDGNLCTNTDAVMVTVNANPTVTFNALPAFCEDASPYTLSEGSPAGGTYSGPGVSGSTFVPASAGPGIWTLSYSYIDGNGCPGSANTSVTVNATPTVTASADVDMCAGGTTTISVTGSAVLYTWDNGLGNGTSFVVSPGTSTTYNVVGDGGNGCFDSDSVMVTVNAIPAVSLTSLSGTCADAPAFALSGGSPAGGSYTGSGVSGGNFNPASVGPGTYLITYSYTDGNGCSNFASQPQEVFSLPVVTANATDVSVCYGEYVTLTGSGASAYAWDNGVSDGIPFQPAVGTVIFTVTGADGNSCQDIDQVTVTTHALPVVDAGPDLTGCEPMLFVTTATGADSYVWDNGVISDNFYTLFAGVYNYMVIGTDVNSCQDTDYVSLTVLANPVVVVSPNQFFCEDQIVNLSATGATNYLWSNGAVTSSVSLSPVATSVITVIGETNGCTDTAAIQLTYDDPNLVSAGTDVVVCAGFTTLLSASGGINYTWTGPNIAPVSGNEFLLLVDTTGYYSVSVETANGCFYTDSVLVTADNGDDCTIEPLNSFSPNGDAVNDYWRIQGIEAFPVNHVTIINRWGDIVFDEQNYDNVSIFWEGTTLDGSDAADGTYFFVIELEGSPARSGWIQLFK
jgi:gliding motility-associated-like protein